MFYFQNKLNGCLKFQLQNELRGNKRQGQYFLKNLEKGKTCGIVMRLYNLFKESSKRE